MSKIAILADVHLGVGNRHKDIIWALTAVRSHCLHNSINHITILGDLFHDRQSLDIEILCKAHQFFKEAKERGQTWIAFPGNHDMFLKHSWDVNSLKPLGELITIIDTVKIIKIGKTRFWVLPFIYSEPSYLKVLAKIEEQYEPGDILLTHIGVCTAKLNVCFLLQHWNIINLENSQFHRIYSGHFHLKQQVADNLWYPGSIIPFKFDEGDSTHGFYVYDTETDTHQFHDIWETAKQQNTQGTPPPQYHNLIDNLIEEKTPEDIKGCNIRIAATKDHTPNERQEIREKLTKMGAKQITFTDILKDDTQDPVEDVAETIKIDQLFQKWYDQDTRGTKDLQRNLALRLNREIVEAGDEIYADREDN